MKSPIFSLVLCLALPGLARPAAAQIIPDQTLGLENSTVQITSPGQVQINGGAIRGANLFHSFEQFSILEQQAAYFANPSGITNILSRVTGSDPSQIFGTLGVSGNANLFLLNPNGIIFGPNARLDIAGAFTASTAESLVLSGGEEFSAVNPGGAPLLTVDVPLNVGLRFGDGAMGAVVNMGALSSDTNLNLVGRSVVNTGQLKGKKVELLGASGTVSQVDLDTNGALAGVVQGESVGDITVTGLPETLPSEIAAVAATPGSTVVSGTIEAVDEVQVLGDRVALTNADIKAKNIQVGGDYRGEGSVLNASRTVVDGGSVLTGERAIVWADDLTVMAGEIIAPGGFVEVSGKERLVFRGEIDADTILFDPRNIIISNATSTTGVTTSLPSILDSNFVGTDITINTGDLESQSGKIILEATNDIVLANNLDFVSGGDITWIADSDGDGVGIINGAAQITKTNGRNITLIAAEMEGLEIFTEGGAISMQSTHGDISGREIETEDPFGANNIEIRSAGNIILQQIDASSFLGDGGEIQVFAEGDVRVQQDVKTDTIFGNAQDITIEAQGDIELSREITTFGQSRNGDISIVSRNGSIAIDTAIVITGDLPQLDSEDVASLSDLGIEVPNNLNSISLPLLETQDDGGDITLIAAERIGMNSTAVVTSGGDDSIKTASGSIRFQGVNGSLPNIDLNNSVIQSDTYSGNAGEVRFEKIDDLTANNTVLQAENERNSIGSSPNLIIDSVGEVNLLNNSSFNIQNQGLQPTGNITVKAKSLNIENSALSITADSSIPTVEGGLLSIEVEENVRVIGIPSESLSASGLVATISNIATGQAQAGDLSINANNVILENEVGVSTLGTDEGGKPGDIKINARETITVRNDSLISADTASNQSGGNIDLTAQDIILEDNGFITASTFNTDSSGNTGNGGNITIVSDQIKASNQSLIATFSSNDGDGGDISLSTQNLQLDNDSAVTVSSDPFADDIERSLNQVNQVLIAGGNSPFVTSISSVTVMPGNGGGNAGTLNINANQIQLSNQSQIVGESSSGNGGNININAQDYLLLRHNSSISTTAGTAQAGGNGGNININAPFILGVPTENSDITANAFSGSGGNININAVAIYGLGFRPFLTPLSDITASSQLGIQGSVTLNLTGADLSQSLTTLPDEPVNTEVAQGCQAIGRGAAVDFMVKGSSRELTQNGSINTDGITARWLSLDLAESATATETPIAQNKISEVAVIPIHNCNM